MYYIIITVCIIIILFISLRADIVIAQPLATIHVEMVIFSLVEATPVRTVCAWLELHLCFQSCILQSKSSVPRAAEVDGDN